MEWVVQIASGSAGSARGRVPSVRGFHSVSHAVFSPRRAQGLTSRLKAGPRARLLPTHFHSQSIHTCSICHSSRLGHVVFSPRRAQGLTTRLKAGPRARLLPTHVHPQSTHTPVHPSPPLSPIRLLVTVSVFFSPRGNFTHTLHARRKHVQESKPSTASKDPLR